MKKIIGGVMLMIAFIFTLASCGGKEEGKYATKAIAVYTSSEKVGDLNLRFYENSPNVPYIGINQFFEEFARSKHQLNKTNTLYKYVKNDDCFMEFDSDTNVLITRNLTGIIGVQERIDNLFIRVNKQTYTKSSDFLIDLDDYGIEVYGGKNDCYVPFAFMSSIVCGELNVSFSYNGDAIYMFSTDDEGNTYGENYYRHLNSNEERAEDVIKYNYNLLCFTFDKLRGYTSQMLFVDFNLVSMGLDGTLTTYYPKIKELLLSKSYSDYKLGMNLLFVGLYDGGHTLISPNDYYYLNDADAEKIVNMDSVSDLYYKFYTKQAVEMLNFPGAAKMQAFGDAATYVDTDGKNKHKPFYYYYNNNHKIAYIGFDSFDLKSEEWKSYYAGDKTKLALLEKEDTYAFVLASLKRAKSDGAKNVVFDLTTNGGGIAITCEGIFGLLNGAKADYTASFVPERRRTTISYDIDVNLDGKFDESDVALANELKNSYKIAILTSNRAFSCGNLLPSLMKDAGFKVIGQKSGGGSCVISPDSTVDGVPYYRSGTLTLCNKIGENIDGGIPVDFPILDESGNLDCEKAFNVEFVANYMKSI